MTTQVLPLAGIRVLDLTLARAGPTAVRHLADWGADVIRIEAPLPPGGVPDEHRDSADFQNLHRNKKMAVLDLKSPSGHAAFLQLAKRADVLVENMRVSVKHRLRIGWSDLHALNPRLVYGSISGYGQTGPYAERAALDPIAQAVSGLMSVTGRAGEGPMRVGIDVADLTAGNILALGIMMALFERHRTGVGRWVHTSLLESMLFMLDFQAARWLADGEVPQQAGNDHPIHIPAGVFRTRNGCISVAASSQRLWPRFCHALGRAEWASRPDWSTLTRRSKARREISSAIEAVLGLHDSAYWIDLLSKAGIPCGLINQVNEAFDDPQVRALGMCQPVVHPRLGVRSVVASPLQIEPLPRNGGSATREFGEDTDAVLREAGIDPLR